MEMMRKIVGTEELSGGEYFMRCLRESGYTAKSFTKTFNTIYQNEPISISTVQSWCYGRRSFSKTAAITVQRVAHILDDPDCSITDYERYAGTIYHLINGIRVPIYE